MKNNEKWNVEWLSPFTDETAGQDARSFCLAQIKEVYSIDYSKVWHTDLDSLVLPASSNWFSAANGGIFNIARDGDGQIVASAGLYDLKRKPATFERLASRYPEEARICQIVRVYIKRTARRGGLGRRLVAMLENDARELGYSVAYLHADAGTPGTLMFWAECGFREFGKFSYPSPTGIDTSVEYEKAFR